MGQKIYEWPTREEQVERKKLLLEVDGLITPGTPHTCLGNGNYPEGFYICNICEHELTCYGEHDTTFRYREK